jgi:hypothetical protein
MKSDLYLKFVLTVIAVALCALVAQNAVRSARAGLGDCGGVTNPC